MHVNRCLFLTILSLVFLPAVTANGGEPTVEWQGKRLTYDEILEQIEASRRDVDAFEITFDRWHEKPTRTLHLSEKSTLQTIEEVDRNVAGPRRECLRVSHDDFLFQIHTFSNGMGEYGLTGLPVMPYRSGLPTTLESDQRIYPLYSWGSLKQDSQRFYIPKLKWVGKPMTPEHPDILRELNGSIYWPLLAGLRITLEDSLRNSLLRKIDPDNGLREINLDEISGRACIKVVCRSTFPSWGHTDFVTWYAPEQDWVPLRKNKIRVPAHESGIPVEYSCVIDYRQDQRFGWVPQDIRIIDQGFGEEEYGVRRYENIEINLEPEFSATDLAPPFEVGQQLYVDTLSDWGTSWPEKEDFESHMPVYEVQSDASWKLIKKGASSEATRHPREATASTVTKLLIGSCLTLIALTGLIIWWLKTPDGRSTKAGNSSEIPLDPS